jgi:hypothetical protein
MPVVTIFHGWSPPRAVIRAPGFGLLLFLIFFCRLSFFSIWCGEWARRSAVRARGFGSRSSSGSLIHLFLSRVHDLVARLRVRRLVRSPVSDYRYHEQEVPRAPSHRWFHQFGVQFVILQFIKDFTFAAVLLCRAWVFSEMCIWQWVVFLLL